LRVFCSLAHAGGNRALRRLREDKATQLMAAVCARLGLRPGQEPPLEVDPGSRPQEAADLLCALGRMSQRDMALNTALSRSLSERLEELEASRLPGLARALGRGDPCDDFVLLHGICRRASASMDELSGTSVVALLHLFSRSDLYDEAFLDAASAQLRGCAARLPAGQLGDAMYALGGLQVRDIPLLDAICEGLRPRIHELGEGDLVRFMRGLVKLRHCHEELIAALIPVIEENKWSLSSVSLTNLISAFSLFETAGEEFFRNLLHAATSRMNRLTTTSVQHIFIALCRQQGRLPRGTVERPLTRLCEHLSASSISSQVTPVQAVSSLAALAKLQHRDLPAASVLTSVLVGRSHDPVWSWAPSANFYARRPLPPGSPFQENRCLKVLQGDLDSSHCVEVLQSLHWLDLHSALTSHLVGLLCSALLPQLHELRAKEVIAVARAVGAYQLPAPASSLPSPGPEDAPAAPCSEAGAGPALSLKEQVADRCFENLRRHEHFLEMSWHALQPFKLLCMEVDAGTFGPRRLREVLNPMLLGFVERLRHLTQQECEANYQKRRGEEEEEEPAGAPATAGGTSTEEGSATKGPMAAWEAGLAPLVLELSRRRVVIGGFVQDFPVDLLIERVR